MLFGGKSRKRPFGASNAFPGMPGPGFTPGIGDGHNQEQQEILSLPEGGSQPDPARQQAKPPSFWQGGDKFRWQDGVAGALAALGDGLSRQAGMEGGGVQMLAGGRLSAIERAKKVQEQAAQRQQTTQALIAAGIDPAQANLGGMGIAKYSDLKRPDAPAAVQTSRWYMTATPEERAAYDATNPIITHGQGSALIPRASLPQPRGLPGGYDPNEWEPVDGPQQPAQAAQTTGGPQMTELQWQGLVSALGPEGAAAFARRQFAGGR